MTRIKIITKDWKSLCNLNLYKHYIQAKHTCSQVLDASGSTAVMLLSLTAVFEESTRVRDKVLSILSESLSSKRIAAITESNLRDLKNKIDILREIKMPLTQNSKVILTYGINCNIPENEQFW